MNSEMANTYTQIHLQFVFAVKYREGLIQSRWKDFYHNQNVWLIVRNFFIETNVRPMLFKNRIRILENLT